MEEIKWFYIFLIVAALVFGAIVITSMITGEPIP